MSASLLSFQSCFAIKGEQHLGKCILKKQICISFALNKKQMQNSDSQEELKSPVLLNKRFFNPFYNFDCWKLNMLNGGLKICNTL